MSPEEDHVEVRRRLWAMFDPDRPDRLCRRGDWTFGPLRAIDAERLPSTMRRLLATLGSQDVHALLRRDRAVALCTVVDEVAPEAHQFIELARGNGAMTVVAGDDLAMVDRLGADLLVAGGEQLAESIRELQVDGCVVALVAGDAPDAHRAADCGIGVSNHRQHFPSGADIVCADDLVDAGFIIEAAAVARQVSRQSAALALLGSSAGSLLALSGPSRSASSRATTAVNVATIIAMANGTRAGMALRPTPLRRPAPSWHELPVDEVLSRLESTSTGLGDRGRPASPGTARAATVGPGATGQCRRRRAGQPPHAGAGGRRRAVGGRRFAHRRGDRRQRGGDRCDRRWHPTVPSRAGGAGADAVERCAGTSAATGRRPSAAEWIAGARRRDRARRRRSHPRRCPHPRRDQPGSRRGQPHRGVGAGGQERPAGGRRQRRRTIVDAL